MTEVQVRGQFGPNISDRKTSKKKKEVYLFLIYLILFMLFLKHKRNCYLNKDDE